MHIWTHESIRFAVILATAIVAFGAGLPPTTEAAFWDSTFGAPGMDGSSVQALVDYAGGVVACGDFTTAGGTACTRIAFWDGENWSPLGAGLNDMAIHMAVIGSDLYVGGLFTSADNVPGTAYIARWDGSAWHAVGTGLNNSVFSLAVFEGQLVAGGRFTMAGSTPANSVATWDGAVWHPMGDGLTVGNPVASVWCFEDFNGELVAGGRFTKSGSTTVNRVARWDGNEWLPLGAGVNQPDGVTTVYDMAIYGGDLIVGGTFQEAGGAPIEDLARWDGSTWHPMTPGGFEGLKPPSVSALTLYQGDLLVGGQFENLVGVPGTAYLARWNGSSWSGMDGGADDVVDDFLVVDEGLVLSGRFTQVGGIQSSHIARWVDMAEWHVATDGDDGWLGTEDRPFLTIARGIYASASGDTVLVHDGTYTGPGNRDLAFGGKGLSIRSLSGNPENCTIDAENDSSGTGWVLYNVGSYGPPVRLQGLSIFGGMNGGVRIGGLEAVVDCIIGNTGNGLVIVDPERVLLRNTLFSACTRGLVNTWGSGLDVADCHFVSCGVGVHEGGPGDLAMYRNCEFANNGTGVTAHQAQARFEDCLFRDNGYGVNGEIYGGFLRCTFKGNTHTAARFYNGDGGGWFRSCTIIDNPGNGIALDGTAYGLNLEETIVANSGGFGVQVESEQACTVTGSLISGNGDLGLGINENWGHTANLVITNTTIVDNGSGLELSNTGNTLITRTIVAFNAGEGLADVGAIYANCDVFGNGANDIADSWALAPGGNLEKDPLFCNPYSGDYGLAANSPCAPSFLHDLIGAQAVACAGVPAPVLLMVQDVPSDQGGQARLTWYRSGHDELGSANPVLGYDIYRRIDPAAMANRPEPGAKLLGWDYVLRVPASGDQGYQVIVPTLCDSTMVGGLCASVFLVSAMTSDPTVFFDSVPDSGYSVDNIAPDPPTGLAAAYQNNQVALEWDDAPETDFQLFRIYRDTDPGFVPGPAHLVGETGASAWIDPATSPWGYHYKITAVDVSGNEGEPGSPNSVSDVPVAVAPARTALLDATPNPFNPATTLHFELAVAGHVRLRVYDTAGRLVTTLVDDSRAIGRHQVLWDGRDGGGRQMASGVYLYRLEAGSYGETRRMVLVK